MLAVMDAPDYLLRVRAVFIAVSSLGILWVYLAAIVLRQRRWQALVAAACLGLSWEYAYHARWAVTDCILTQFSALTLLTLVLYQRRGNLGWLYAAAVAAGLGTGTKYTGVFLLAPVLYAGALTLPLGAFRAQVRRAVEVCVLAFATYLVTTPATVLDPMLFLSETKFISTYYLYDHGGFTASSAWHHGWIVLSYFALSYFSPYMWLAALEFVFCVAGVVLWLKGRARFGLLMTGFPLLFLLFFCARYRVVMVRNYLFLVPFMALLVSRAVADFMAWLPRRPLKYAFAAGLVGVLLAQAAFLVIAGESIRHLDPALYAKQALDYVRDHADTRFRVSSQVRALARAQGLDMPANVSDGSDATQVVFFGKAEGPNPWKWATNDPFLTKAVFGPREVAFNWYSSWAGNDRVVIMDRIKAKATDVLLAQ
jgi:4-amino-4-deoxy-L-arabinose transferase-like glycosyltransferase